MVWVESIYVESDFRQQGIASILFDKAEEKAKELGGTTLYNWIHPNNHKMIQFLSSKGYNVLNLIEIRKPLENENLTTTIQVGDHHYWY